jgi:hypothetical protein
LSGAIHFVDRRLFEKGRDYHDGGSQRFNGARWQGTMGDSLLRLKAVYEEKKISKNLAEASKLRNERSADGRNPLSGGMR